MEIRRAVARTCLGVVGYGAFCAMVVQTCPYPYNPKTDPILEVELDEDTLNERKFIVKRIGQLMNLFTLRLGEPAFEVLSDNMRFDGPMMSVSTKFRFSYAWMVARPLLPTKYNFDEVVHYPNGMLIKYHNNNRHYRTTTGSLWLQLDESNKVKVLRNCVRHNSFWSGLGAVWLLRKIHGMTFFCASWCWHNRRKKYAWDYVVHDGRHLPH
eukprot:Platyproteum_vivax@DN15007_c0_g1_i1.p1